MSTLDPSFLHLTIWVPWWSENITCMPVIHNIQFNSIQFTFLYFSVPQHSSDFGPSILLRHPPEYLSKYPCSTLKADLFLKYRFSFSVFINVLACIVVLSFTSFELFRLSCSAVSCMSYFPLLPLSPPLSFH